MKKPARGGTWRLVLGAAAALGCSPTGTTSGLASATASGAPSAAAPAPPSSAAGSASPGPNCAACAGVEYKGRGECLRARGAASKDFAPIPTAPASTPMSTAWAVAPGLETEPCDSRCCLGLVPARSARCGRPASMTNIDGRRHLYAPWLAVDRDLHPAQTGAWQCQLSTRQGDRSPAPLPRAAGAEPFERRRVLTEGVTREEELLWTYVDPAWAARVVAALPELDRLAIRGARAEVAARCRALWDGEPEHAVTRAFVEAAADAYVATGAVPEGALPIEAARGKRTGREITTPVERAAERCGWTTPK